MHASNAKMLYILSTGREAKNGKDLDYIAKLDLGGRYDIWADHIIQQEMPCDLCLKCIEGNSTLTK